MRPTALFPTEAVRVPVTVQANLTGVRPHDLPQTNTSFGGCGGLGLPIIGRLPGRNAHLDDDALRSKAIVGRIAVALQGGETASAFQSTCGERSGTLAAIQVISPVVRRNVCRIAKALGVSEIDSGRLSLTSRELEMSDLFPNGSFPILTIIVVCVILSLFVY